MGVFREKENLKKTQAVKAVTAQKKEKHFLMRLSS